MLITCITTRTPDKVATPITNHLFSRYVLALARPEDYLPMFHPYSFRFQS